MTPALTALPFRVLALFTLFLALTAQTQALVRLASPFTDHLVLQRDQSVPIWGTADVGEKVTVSFADQTKSTQAAADGRWSLELDALAASSEGRALEVSGSATPDKILLTDVLVGEVWLCSGQSNMVFTVSKAKYPWAGVRNEGEEIAAASHPLIRVFTGGEQKSLKPQTSLAGTWVVCSPQTVPAVSAVGYFFARELQKELQVPVGILVLAYGASTAQAWLRREAIAEDPRLNPVLTRFDEQVKTHVPPTAAELQDWERAAELARAEHKRPPSKPGQDPVQDQHNPTVLFNGMIAPVVPYALRGILWYQGESITSPRELFPHWNALLIADRRQLWNRQLPFYFCQLAALENKSNAPDVRAWQAEALAISGTGMVVTTDLGEEKDVHPHDKAPVGFRLARLALAQTYGRELEYSGPVLVSTAQEGSYLRLRFTHTSGGLVARGGPLQTFEMAGADGRFFPAEAVIDNDTVRLHAEAVALPVVARYAWSNYPAKANLFNAAGFPSAPFFTPADRQP